MDNYINDQLLSVLACPTCKSSLSFSVGTLRCKSCNKTYPIKDKIIDFLDQEKLNEVKSVNSEYHDKEADYYDELHLHMAKENKLFKKIIKDIEISGKNILDIGTGTGFIIDNFRKEVQFVCLDISSQMLQRTMIKHPGQILLALRGDAEQIPITSNSMDIIFISSTLHHLPHWEKCLNEVYRILKPEGWFILFHEPYLKQIHNHLYIRIQRLYDKTYGVVIQRREAFRGRKGKKIARVIFGLNEKKSFQKMQRFNQVTNVHNGFIPINLVSPDYYKNITVKTYYAQQTIYHRLMSLFFPTSGELFYIKAIKKAI
ncbi:MAG: methyltransferase domain-containing protein [bacterium]|nr:methyltransferase domain-containing protein [bacterium]